MLVLANSINLGERKNLFFGLKDDNAILDNPDLVWGKMIEYRVNVIQTDFPQFLSKYRDNK